MATYHTEGIVKEVELTQENGTFSIEASAPFAIEDTNSESKEKFILFIADADESKSTLAKTAPSKTSKEEKHAVAEPKTIRRDAFLVSGKARFIFTCSSKPIDTTALLLLKQNRNAIRIVIDGNQTTGGGTDGDPTFLINSIKVK